MGSQQGCNGESLALSLVPGLFCSVVVGLTGFAYVDGSIDIRDFFLVALHHTLRLTMTCAPLYDLVRQDGFGNIGNGLWKRARHDCS